MSESKSKPAESRPANEPVDAGRRSALTFVAIGVAAAVGGLLVPRSAQANYGKCYLCSCCNFVGTHDTCNTCGHTYTDHTGQTCSRIAT